MGSVYVIKDSGRYGICYMSDGKKISERTQTRSREQALDILRRREGETKQGLKDRPTLDRLLDQVIQTQVDDKDISERTVERYRYCRDAILAKGSPLKDKSLDEISKTDLDQYIKHRQKQGIKRSSYHKEITWLKSALSDAYVQGFLSLDVKTGIDATINAKKHRGLKGYNRRRKRILYRREMIAISKATQSIDDRRGNGQKNGNLDGAWKLALWTGLRLDNVRAIRHRHIDRLGRLIRFLPGEMKNDEEHIVYLSPVAMEIVEGRLSDQYPDDPDRLLFHDFTSSWKRLLVRLEAAREIDPDLHFHDLRRTYISYRLTAGIHPAHVMDEVGHLDERMTMSTYRSRIKDPDTIRWVRENFGWSHLGGESPSTLQMRAEAVI